MVKEEHSTYRKAYLDAAKGGGILLVVLGHSLELYLGDAPSPAIFTLWKFIYSFHMPLFFLLSGMAAERLGGVTRDKALSAALTLILIATGLQLTVAPVRLAVAWPADALPVSLASGVRYVLWPAVKLEGYALVVTWFLPCLALVRLTVWLVANLERAAAAAFLTALGVLCLLEQSLGVGYFQLRSILVGTAFFALGQHAAAWPLERLPRLAYAAGAVVGLLLVALTFGANHGCAFDPVRTCPGPRYGQFAVLMASGAFGFIPLFALTALAGAVAVVSASLLLPGARWLTSIGRRTLELLVINGLVLVFVQPVLAPHVAGLAPPLVIVPLVIAQLAFAALFHPTLARVLSCCRDTAGWLASLRAPTLSRTPR